jgi:hypothetical protein
VSDHFIDGNKLQEGMLNRVSAVVRAYDPCLSCSTHAVGGIALKVSLVGPGGRGSGRSAKGMKKQSSPSCALIHCSLYLKSGWVSVVHVW